MNAALTELVGLYPKLDCPECNGRDLTVKGAEFGCTTIVGTLECSCGNSAEITFTVALESIGYGSMDHCSGCGTALDGSYCPKCEPPEPGPNVGYGSMDKEEKE